MCFFLLFSIFAMFRCFLIQNQLVTIVDSYYVIVNRKYECLPQIRNKKHNYTNLGRRAGLTWTLAAFSLRANSL